MLRLAGAHDVTGQDVDAFDITSENDCRRVVQECSPEVVINAAAYTNVDGCETDRERCFAVNAVGVKNIALACRGRGITDRPFQHRLHLRRPEEDRLRRRGPAGAAQRLRGVQTGGRAVSPGPCRPLAPDPDGLALRQARQEFREDHPGEGLGGQDPGGRRRSDRLAHLFLGSRRRR